MSCSTPGHWRKSANVSIRSKKHGANWFKTSFFLRKQIFSFFLLSTIATAPKSTCVKSNIIKIRTHHEPSSRKCLFVLAVTISCWFWVTAELPGTLSYTRCCEATMARWVSPWHRPWDDEPPTAVAVVKASSFILFIFLDVRYIYIYVYDHIWLYMIIIWSYMSGGHNYILPTRSGHGQSGWSPIGCAGFNTNLNSPSPVPTTLVFH